MTETDLDRIMEQYDTNRDGVIQFEEFVAMVRTQGESGDQIPG